MNLENPNIPNNKVKKVLIGRQWSCFHEKLLSLGVECAYVLENKSLQKPLMCHADMNVLHLGSNKFALAKGIEIKDFSCKSLFEIELSNIYPKDISLNIALIGKYAVIGKKNCANELVLFVKKEGYTPIFVSQGYCKCSCSIVNQNALITDDESIYNGLKPFLDVLLIQKGDISLPGYDVGFIGGASGLIDKNLIAFTGDIKLHRDFKKIYSFLKKHNCDYICLSDGKLIDIGGILPISV